MPVASASDQNIQVVNWDSDNSSCNGLLNLTNTTIADTWNVTLTNVTDGIEYRIYNSTEHLLDSAIATSGSAVLEFTGIEDGIYKIVELSNPRLLWTYWHPENSNPTGIVEVSQSSGYNYINFTISNPTASATYWLYNPETLELLGNGTKYINVTGLTDGRYYIAKTGTEKIIIESWTPDSENRIGEINITDSTRFSVWKFIIHNAGSGHTYKLIDGNNEEVAEAITIRGDATLTATGLPDGIYYVYLENVGYQSYVKPALILGSLITISYVLASTFNRRRKHE